MFLVQLVGSLTKSSRIFSIRSNRYSNSLGRQPISVVYRDDVVLLQLLQDPPLTLPLIATT